jgi:alkyldihydroxyacetonephosphate synthase
MADASEGRWPEGRWPEGRWAGWGDPARAVTLPPRIHALLDAALGVRPGPGPVELADVKLAPSRLSPQALDALAGSGLAQHVRTDAEARARHCAGKSTADLVRLRAGETPHPPDAVVYPGSHDEVLDVLRACDEHRITVVPFGGGTSVVGGLAPAAGATDRPVIALDLRRLDRLVGVDPISRTATLQAGLRAPQADALLAAHGYTLGHLPQSYEYATIGGFAATRSSGQASSGYGRFDSMVVGLTVATPTGTVELGQAPASAAGPDLRQLFLGSEGALGVITSVTLRVRPLPASRRFEGWRFESFQAGTNAVRRLAQDGPLPAVLRLSDEFETATGSHGSGGCLLVAGYEGGGPDAAQVLREAGGTPLGAEPGEEWAATRFAAPYLRDAMLDAGAFVEVVETATFWSRLPDLYAGVRTALLEALDPALVLCHISHVYETGASLYFTVVCALGDDPLGRWAAAKAQASDAILAAGGTISHHHGVGTDHRAWYEREIGPLGVQALRAVKSRLDPNGILNPGILLP